MFEVGYVVIDLCDELYVFCVFKLLQMLCWIGLIDVVLNELLCFFDDLMFGYYVCMLKFVNFVICVVQYMLQVWYVVFDVCCSMQWIVGCLYFMCSVLFDKDVLFNWYCY